MNQQANALKRFDQAGVAAVEHAFRSGPLRAAMERAPEIPRLRGASVEAFDRDVRGPQQPMVFEGMVDSWPALHRWSLDFFAQRCGDSRVVVNGYDSQRAREITLGAFVAALQSPRDGRDPMYVQEWYYKNDPAGLAADTPELPIAQYDFRRDLYGEEISTNHQLWFGQKNGVTILHQDSYMVDVMHIQVVGEKRWYVMAPTATLPYGADGEPDFQALSVDPSAQLMQCTLRPGEVLYLPALWWHRVELLSDSIGIGRKCLDPRNLRQHVRLRMAELLCLALNADEVQSTHSELYPVVLKRARTWAKRMSIDLANLRP